MIKLKLDRFEELQIQVGKTDDKSIAEYIGVNRSTVYRIKKGKMIPGPDFIASVLKAFPEHPFEDLFFVA